jgi:hypothetical protein
MADDYHYRYTKPINGLLNLDFAKVDALNESQVFTDAFSDEGDTETAR